MRTANVAEAKTHLSKLIDAALAGEEVVIRRHGKPLVKLTPFKSDPSPRDLSVRIWEGEVRTADDFDELPPEFIAAFTRSDEPSP